MTLSARGGRGSSPTEPDGGKGRSPREVGEYAVGKKRAEPTFMDLRKRKEEPHGLGSLKEKET